MYCSRNAEGNHQNAVFRKGKLCIHRVCLRAHCQRHGKLGDSHLSEDGHTIGLCYIYEDETMAEQDLTVSNLTVRFTGLEGSTPKKESEAASKTLEVAGKMALERPAKSSTKTPVDIVGELLHTMSPFRPSSKVKRPLKSTIDSREDSSKLDATPLELESIKIKVAGLKTGFDMELLQFALNRSVTSYFGLDKKTECFVSSTNVDENTALLELVCDEWANHLVKKGSFQFDGYTVELGIPAGVSVSPTPLEVKANQIQVSGLKAGFDMELLQFALNRSVTSYFGLDKKTECFVSSTNVDENTALLELVCDEWAKHLALKRSIQFEGSQVTISSDVYPNASDSDSDEEDSNVTLLKNSCYIKISNLPIPFDKVDLQHFLTRKMVDANFISDGEKCVEEFLDLEDASSCIMKFHTCEEANLACLLELIKYKSCILKIVKYSVDKDNNDLESTPPNEEFYSLHSDHGKLIYIQMLIKYRDSFRKSGCHDKILDGIRVNLEKHYKVLATLAELRAFRQDLMKQHRNRKRSDVNDHPLSLPCAVIFDGADKDALNGTKYDVNGIPEEEVEQADFNNSLLKFSTVAAWSLSSETALVNILIDKQDDYWKPMRKSTFWNEVSLRMLEEKYPYTAAQCENHLDKNLKPAFKDFEDLNQSGSAAIERVVPAGTRKLLGLMQDFMGHCVSVRPLKTFAAGFMAQDKRAPNVYAPCSSQATDTSRSSACSSQAGDTSRSGRNRPTVLKRKPNPNLSLKERKMRSEKMKAKALMMLAKSRSKPTVTREENNYDDDEFDDL